MEENLRKQYITVRFTGYGTKIRAFEDWIWTQRKC